MTRKLLYPFIIFLIFSCAQDDSSFAENSTDDVAITTRGKNKVSVCHKGKIINVSINAVPAHQGHGDAIDMDNDGYFDNDNVCSPTDCNDSDPALTDNCISCSFCTILDLWDFDETCYDDTGNYLSGDYSCIYDFSWDNKYGPCESYFGGALHSAAIFDRDDAINTCQDDSENDTGFIFTYYQNYIQCGENILRGGFRYKLTNDMKGNIIAEGSEQGEGQDYYDLGVFCSNIIANIVSDVGIPEAKCNLGNRINQSSETNHALKNLTDEDQDQVKMIIDLLNTYKRVDTDQSNF